MSDSKEQSESANVLSFLPKPPISFSENDDSVYDSRAQTDFPQFNDSNSDDTQFEIQSGELHSNDTSPVKDKAVLDKPRKNENQVRKNKYIHHDRAPRDQQHVEENLLQPDNSNSLKNADATSFVDYFLAHDDLLEALDDYSRSVGLTSVFPPEVAPASLPQHEKYESSEDVCNISSSLQRGNVIQRNVATDHVQCRVEEESNGFAHELGCEKTTESSKQQKGQGRLDSRHSKSITAPRRTEKRKPRTYSQAIPSQHCHICSRRPTETSPHAVCGNLLKGRCRKTICTKCFHQFRWDLKAAREAPPGTWECPHCRGECPQRAQCVIYNRTSDRRRMKLINHRKKKDETKISTVRKYEMNSKANEKTQSRTDSPDSGTTTMAPLASLNSCSFEQGGVCPTNASKLEMTSLQSSGISKPLRTSGMTTYAQFAQVADEIYHEMIPEGNGQNQRSGLRVLSGAEMVTPEYILKVEGFDEPHQPEIKREISFLEEKELEANGRSGSEEVADGILNYMGFSGDVLNVVTAEKNETGTGMIVGNRSEELDSNLGLLDIEKSIERGKEDPESAQGRLPFWGDEEMEVEEFTFNENRLGFDEIV